MIVKLGSEVRSPRFLGHLEGYLLFAITSSRVNRLCSFFNMMRISSSATNKGVYFGFAVLEKLSSKLALGFTPEAFDPSADTIDTYLEALNYVTNLSVLESPVSGESPHIYFVCSFM